MQPPRQIRCSPNFYSSPHITVGITSVSVKDMAMWEQAQHPLVIVLTVTMFHYSKIQRITYSRYGLNLIYKNYFK